MTILVEFVCWDCVLFVDFCFRILGFSKETSLRLLCHALSYSKACNDIFRLRLKMTNAV